MVYILEKSSKLCMARSPCEPLQCKSRTNGIRETSSGNSIGDSMTRSTAMSGHTQISGSTLVPENNKIERGSTIRRECRMEVMDPGYIMLFQEQTSKTN
jgi:hypothetical protein